MKLPALLALAAASLALALPAAAAPVTFVAHLDGPSEATPNASTAFGDASVTFDDAALTVAVHVDFTGLTGGPATMAHLHCCTATPFAGAVGVFQGFPGFPNATSGTYDNLFALSASAFSTLLAGTESGRAYVNIHNTTFPGGEIRGFLVPEPATTGLLAAGLGLVAVARRRRQGTRADA